MKQALSAALLISILIVPGIASAGAKVEIDRESYLDLGFRLHTIFVLDSDSAENDRWHLKAGRLRAKGVVNKYAMAFIQTDTADGEMAVLDAFAAITPDSALNIFIGRNMAPSSRQNLTSTEAMLAVDRPAIANKSLTWGARAVPVFGTKDYADSNPGINSEIMNRDTGITFHGLISPLAGLYVKYYLGTYNGIQLEDNSGKSFEKPRFTGRVQLNLFDPEENYYNFSTYIKEKKTVSVGASYDYQNRVAKSASEWADYRYYSLDLFTEMPIGPGSLTFEAAYMGLGLSGTSAFASTEIPVSGASGKSAEGSGYFAQAGYYINKVQPWIMYESWESTSSEGQGGFWSGRAGVTYYIKDHNASVKFGVEYFKPEDASEQGSILSMVFGFFAQY